MRRLLIVFCLLMGTASSAYAVPFKAAKLLEAEAYPDHLTGGSIIKGNGMIYTQNHDMNRIAVSLEGMKITGVFESHWSWSTKASGLVVGTMVQARVEKDKLIVMTPEGKTIKARIVRREMESPAGQSKSEVKVSAREMDSR